MQMRWMRYTDKIPRKNKESCNSVAQLSPAEGVGLDAESRLLEALKHASQGHTENLSQAGFHFGMTFQWDDDLQD